MPVMEPVNIGDGNFCKLLVRDIGETPEIDAIHFAEGRFIADAKAANAAVLAEIVMVFLCVEQILCQLRLASKQAKVLGLGYSRPESGAPAYGAIATE